ncbi:GntP family permease [Isachenkonia alkalipeptolytica]|uniref:GntP family permease n=1 Tax=Isachenkonia alkalipeptolytica TaxID=2565777 RepID=A0AA43XLR8_9CLOT|nr:GntP family permease [Isachenkonia alkalipeptolytica]NBG88265.1 GntP family permease [Isachenkonia alkalipeptolytica]
MIGIIIGLALLMFLAYKGLSIIWIAPLCALVVAITGGLDLLPAYTEAYMGGFVGFTKSWFPVFMLGAVFGKVMEDSGAAQSVAQWLTSKFGKKAAISAVVAGCAVLTFGGISLFVVVFAMYPIALSLFREANITRKLIPGTIALGSFTFTMTAIPGTPQIQNLIPMEYYGTSATAAPIMGIVGAIIMCGGGIFFLEMRRKKYNALGDVYDEPKDKAPEIDLSKLPNPALSALPLLTVISLLNIFDLDIIVALLAGILLGVALNIPRIESIKTTLNQGASSSVIAIINTSAAVGFGTVVRAVPGFETLTELVMGIQGSPLISQAVSVNILAGATGSASGGMGIALAALGDQYLQIAQATGIPPEAFHRIASMSSGGLDTLPHNGAVLTLLAVTAMTHKDSYKEIFVVGSLIPIAAVIAGIILGSIGLV